MILINFIIFFTLYITIHGLNDTYNKEENILFETMIISNNNTEMEKKEEVGLLKYEQKKRYPLYLVRIILKI